MFICFLIGMENMFICKVFFVLFNYVLKFVILRVKVWFVDFKVFVFLVMKILCFWICVDLLWIFFIFFYVICSFLRCVFKILCLFFGRSDEIWWLIWSILFIEDLICDKFLLVLIIFVVLFENVLRVFMYLLYFILNVLIFDIYFVR